MTPQQLGKSAQEHAAQVFPDMMNDLVGNKPWPEVRQYLADAYVQGAVDERTAQWIRAHDRVPNSKNETVRNLRKSDEDSESEALLNQIPDTAKMVDNIIKDGFRDHNRLHIASIAMAGILAAPLDNVGFITNKCVDDVAEYALRCADALLELTANTTKGGSK